MLTSSFSYNLPKELIAQSPAKPRDHSRLMVLDKKSGKIEHHNFFELPNLLKKGDVLIFNNSKVFKARLIGKKETGGKVEVFLHRPLTDNKWEVLIKGRNIKKDDIITLSKNLVATIKNNKNEIFIVAFNKSGLTLQKIIDKIGHVPLPPYIKKSSRLSQYQTIYAKTRGSVAAPTAGLHFTKRILSLLKKKDIQIEYITLHVGLGTFQPIKTNEIEGHIIHSELATINKQTAKRLNKAKDKGQRIIAVGTTSVRTLEAFSDFKGDVSFGIQDINLFITPGYKFKFIDSMITNFHLPESSLLVLISALSDKKKILQAYKTAVKKKYRFYSFGDSMFIQ